MSHKILHTEWSKGWGGQEIRIVAESVAFIEKGYDMLIACQPDSQILQKAREAGIKTEPLVIPKRLSLTTILACIKLIKKYKIDIVHTHSSKDAWNCGIAGKIAGVPVIRSRHLSAPISHGLLSYFLYMKLANRVITSGKAIREEMIKKNSMLAEKIISIPAGVDENRFSLDVDATSIKEEFGLSNSDFVVGIVAVLRSWKGHDFLIKAAITLIEKNIPLKLLIVGAGPCEDHIKDLIKNEEITDSVIMTGYRKDIPNLIKAMDCFVLPSTKNEATSQVLPQAMAMKIPVVASDAGGLSEVVINQKTGLLVPPENVDALVTAIESIYKDSDLTEVIVENAYQHCLDNFTFNKMISDTEKVYLSVLKSFH